MVTFYQFTPFQDNAKMFIFFKVETDESARGRVFRAKQSASRKRLRLPRSLRSCAKTGDITGVALSGKTTLFRAYV